jgi:hypothetical protein
MNTPTHRTQLSGRRKFPLLILLAVMLFAAGSARATLMINANEVGGDVVFTLSGSFNTSSAMNGGIGFDRPPNAINPSTAQFSFSHLSGEREWVLPNFAGPASFGVGGSTSTPIGGANISFGGFFFTGNDWRLFIGDVGYSSGTAFMGSMTFAGQSFASLGITPGMYDWSWNNSGISDSLTLNVNRSQGVPDTGSTVVMLGLGLAGMTVAARRSHFVRAVRPA